MSIDDRLLIHDKHPSSRNVGSMHVGILLGIVLLQLKAGYSKNNVQGLMKTLTDINQTQYAPIFETHRSKDAKHTVQHIIEQFDHNADDAEKD